MERQRAFQQQQRQNHQPSPPHGVPPQAFQQPRAATQRVPEEGKEQRKKQPQPPPGQQPAQRYIPQASCCPRCVYCGKLWAERREISLHNQKPQCYSLHQAWLLPDVRPVRWRRLCLQGLCLAVTDAPTAPAPREKGLHMFEPLLPVNFLRRAARLFPDKPPSSMASGVIPTVPRGARQPPVQCSAADGGSQGDKVAVLSPTAIACSKPFSPCRNWAPS